MAILSDVSIVEAVLNGDLEIDPFDQHHVQPSGYDLMVQIDGPLWIVPGRLYLLSTIERVRLPGNIQGQLWGRSSLGRLGVTIHMTAGLIDPYFDGQITLEVMAMDKAQMLTPGDRVAQIVFA